MKLIKKDKRIYEIIEKPVSVKGIEDELQRLKDEKRNRGFEVYDEPIRRLEDKLKQIKCLK